MNYIIIGCISIVILHFILYYLNIDPFELSNKPLVNTTLINTTSNTKNNNDIEESINELKKLNEYIDNEYRHITDS